MWSAFGVVRISRPTDTLISRPCESCRTDAIDSAEQNPNGGVAVAALQAESPLTITYWMHQIN